MTSKQLNIIFICLCLFISSCKSGDLFIKEAENSSLNLALIFLGKYENPKNKKTINFCYEKLDTATKNRLTYPDFHNSIMIHFPKGKLINRKVEINPWEKIDLNDGSVLIYLLKKFKFKKIKRKFGEYSIIRLHLIKENEKWGIDIENSQNFKGFTPVASGSYSSLTEAKIEELRKIVKKDSEEYQFNLDKMNMDSQDKVFAKKCISEGEKLYDREEYRKALMQFQKALSIDPEDKKALIYIDRCKKAISFGVKEES